MKSSTFIKMAVFTATLIVFSYTSCKKDVYATCYSIDNNNNGQIVEKKKACGKDEGEAEKKAISMLTIKEGYHVVCETQK